eukprot:CAMPEP_0201550690 /NCGR_PEP_ID=MMETSP0173_2-20130828/7011_1 /ASSEMBLY_ACC=CAM_ASM_000268 /TAXON_ID=218659 /ORGANISM="Vexillifera sp., Strain DIVA3 564/2" /LENGTH=62 /DNA_ID=CAMNT_0047960735 /DNA_START=453 /DNA_END=638 /DNA_ORIENTATION=+
MESSADQVDDYIPKVGDYVEFQQFVLVSTGPKISEPITGTIKAIDDQSESILFLADGNQHAE